MLPTGYPADVLAGYERALRSHFELRTQVRILDNSRRVLSTLPNVVLDGQIDAKRIRLDPSSTSSTEDQQIEVSRMAKSVKLYDPTRALALDANSPADGAMYLDRMIQIICSVRLPAFGLWFDTPVHTGPITSIDRDGPVVNLEAQGMESFGTGDAYVTGTIKGTKIAAAMELLSRMGEEPQYYDLPTTAEKLAKDIGIARDTRYWDKLFATLVSLNRLCFYDARSYLRTPAQSFQPVITFEPGNNQLLMSEPKVKHSIDKFKNAWWEQTSTTAGKDVSAVAVLPDSHPLSPLKLGRNGKPKYRMGQESNSDLRTEAKALERAKTNLQAASLEVQVEFESRPVYHLEAFDYALLKTDDYSMPFPIQEYSLPIVAGKNMTVGYQADLANPNIAKIRGL